MTWPRPVPIIGDTTTSAGRASDPQGWAFPIGDRDALYRILEERRDVRRFRPDPVDRAVVDRVLGAAHAAPSVGHSQPWRFLVVRDHAVRHEAAILADRERLAQARRLDPESARHLLDLQLEGIREAPMGIVVCCDRRTPGPGVLGRATFDDADLWSCACAIENLWLAARAEGLGLGWVTLFEPGQLAALVGLPDGVSTLGWLCLGWPDERPPIPGLEHRGWSARLPLSDVVIDERWPGGAGSGPALPRSRLAAPDPEAVVGARDQADTLLSPPGSLGALDRILDRVAALGVDCSDPGWLVLAASDHPVVAHRVSAYDQAVTREVLLATVAGDALGAVAARRADLGVVAVDAGVNGPPVPGAHHYRPSDRRGDLVGADALSPADGDRLVELGRALGEQLGRVGLVALGEVGVGNTTVAGAVAAAILDADAGAVVGLGAGADSAMLRQKHQVIEAALARARRRPRLSSNPWGILVALGGGELAVLTGVVLGASGAGAAIVVDGLATAVAAGLAVLIEPAAAAHLVAGHRSRETAHGLLLDHLGLEPVLDLRLRAGEGVGAALATGVLRHAMAIRRYSAVTSTLT